MGEYRCPLKDKLKPNSHNEWHPDWQSYVCPILRDELAKAIENENWKRLKMLIKLGEEAKQL